MKQFSSFLVAVAAFMSSTALAAPVPQSLTTRYGVICRCTGLDTRGVANYMIRSEDTLKLDSNNRFYVPAGNSKYQFMRPDEFIAKEFSSSNEAEARAFISRIDQYVQEFGSKLDGLPEESICTGRLADEGYSLVVADTNVDTPADQVFIYPNSNPRDGFRKAVISVDPAQTFTDGARGHYHSCRLIKYVWWVDDAYTSWLRSVASAASVKPSGR